MLNYHSAAKILDLLMIELIEKGAEIPAHVVGDLKSGRSFASILLRSPGDDIDIAAKAALALENVEMNLLSAAEIKAGADYAEMWQKKIIEAYKEDIVKPAPVSASRLVSGVPKGEHWIRVQTSELTEFYKQIPDKPPEAFGLAALGQGDGFTVIYGKKENVTDFLNCMKQIYKRDKRD